MHVRLWHSVKQSAILLLMLLVLLQCGRSQLDLTPSASRGFVQVTVTTPDGKPLPGVAVAPTKTPNGAVLPAMIPATDQQGRYTWGFDMPGRYAITVTKTGYISQTREVVVQPKSTATLDFVLEPEGSP